MPVALALAYAAVTLLQVALASLNLRYLGRHARDLPAEFEGMTDAATLEQSARYTVERTRLGVLSSVLSSLVVLAFVFGGGLPAYDALIGSLVTSFVARGVLFFVGLGVLSSVLGLPLSIYATFVVEARYGFNRTTPKLFFADWLKGLLLGGVITAALAGGALALVHAAPALYWLWAWLFFCVMSVFLILISPIVIEPLFFQFKPLSSEELARDARALADRVGVKLERVLEVDASKRSSHSNAYFTGLGRVKRVVLFDTLLVRMSRSEILAVLAHELGHWKLGHIVKRLLVTQAVALVAIYVASQAIAWSGLPALIGVGELSFAARAVVLGFVASIPGFFVTPLSARWSRKHEREADEFARDLTGQPRELASALLKLARDNLSNLHPHPLYAAFYYSHPPVIERVRRLRAQ
jgi:STE24 endopeptidase